MTYRFTEKGPLSGSKIGEPITVPTGSATTLHSPRGGGKTQGRVRKFEEIHLWVANETTGTLTLTLTVGGTSTVLQVTRESKLKVMDGEVILGGATITGEGSGAGLTATGYFQRAEEE